jgi:hypothetical protein
MAVVKTIYPVSVTFNGVTYDKSTHGLIRLRYQHGGEELADRVAEEFYPTLIAATNGYCRVQITVREVKQTPTVGTNGALVATISTPGASTTLTFATMTYLGVESEQGRATPGEATLSFAHQSANGSTAPLS